MKLYQWNGHSFLDYADYPNYSAEDPPFPAVAGFQWIEGDLPKDAPTYVEIPLTQKIQTIILKGQALLASEPLPLDIQRGIFQQLTFLKTYVEYNALDVIQADVTAFSVAPNRPDVSQKQYSTVETLKQEILDLVNSNPMNPK